MVVALVAVVMLRMSVVVVALVAVVMLRMSVVVVALMLVAMFGCHSTAPLHRDGGPVSPGRRPSFVTGYHRHYSTVFETLRCVGCVVRVVRVRAVLLAVLVAVLSAVLVELLAPADGHAGLVAVDVAVTCAVLVAVHVAMVVTVLAFMLVAMVSRFAVVVLVNVSGHLSSLSARSRISREFMRDCLPHKYECQ